MKTKKDSTAQQKHVPNKLDLLVLLKLAVSLQEHIWEIEHDIEQELGFDVDGLDELISDLAVMGSKGVSSVNVQDIFNLRRV